MNKDTIPCCAADALWRIRKVKINGVMTGVTRLDECIAAVAEENLTREEEIRESLMKKIRIANYIPPGVEEAYGTALMEEYHTAMRKRNTGNTGGES